MLFCSNPEETSPECKASYQRYVDILTQRPRENRRADAAVAKWNRKHRPSANLTPGA